MRGIFEKYLLSLRKTRLEDKTEHTDRSSLETLLQAIAEKVDTGIRVQHEPKRDADKGAPDFKISESGMILGYVESKAIDEKLTKVLKSEQIAKYKSLSKNIIVTDYLEFIWINKYGIPTRATVPRDRPREPETQTGRERVDAVATLLEGSSRRRQMASAARNARARARRA